MSIGVVSALAIISTIVLTVLVYALIMPKSRYSSMGGFGKFLHDFFQFKKLYLESVLRFFYVVNTLLCVSFGVFLLFGKMSIGWGSEKWTGGIGLAVLILGPIVTRLTYEGLMLGILLVKNTIDINNKLGGNNGESISFANNSSFTEKFSNVAVNAAAGAAASVQQAQQNYQANHQAQQQAQAQQPYGQPVQPAQAPTYGQPAPAPATPVAPEAPVAPTPETPATPAAPVCPKCGAPAAEGSKFCIKCGSPLNN